MADSVSVSGYGNSCTLTINGVTVTRTSDTTISVCVSWSTSGNATKGQASVNGTRVHDSTASTVPHSQTDSGECTFTVSDSNKKQHTNSFSISVAARYGSSGAWQWLSASDTCDYIVPKSTPEVFVNPEGTVKEIDEIYLNVGGVIVEADTVYLNVGGVIVEA